MDCLNVAEGRGSPKREFSRLSRARNQRAMIRSNILEAMAQVRNSGSEDGVVRMKIVVKKQEPKSNARIDKKWQQGERESPELLEACAPEHP
ncbi:hypothetical protein Acr_09g0009920 [Actinidia rufa]|uniref:Uncharacterized protein n=1 Tax=Actinidia rufa TaxID=165716 RepID=A0A7J0F814_9ERIC|nr:hypothetical protein Acr_09g0009920 [Actinidia rufa]